jgi:hypothetical protein
MVLPTSTLRHRWDLVIVFFVLYNAIMVPFVIGAGPSPPFMLAKELCGTELPPLEFRI